MAGRFDPMLPGWPGGRAAALPAVKELNKLADAVREHESITTRRAVPKRPADHQLYRRLAEIEASSSERRNGG